MSNKERNFMSCVKVGAKGQIVIPKEIRDMFDIEPNDMLVIFADIEKGIAIQKQSVMTKIAATIFGGKGKDIYPNEPEENLEAFASAIKKAVEPEENDDCH